MIEEDRKSLGMTIGKAHKIISKWTKDYKKANKNARQLKILLTDGLKIGDGISQQDMGNNHIIMMGMHPYSLSEKDRRMADMDFVKMGTTFFHELAHYEDDVSGRMSKEDAITCISKFHNIDYHKKNWNKMSHEISAEYRGVMSMWAQMEQMYPDDADRLMLERLTEWAKNTNYILKAPKDRFTSKTQVKFLFHRAAIERMNEKKDLPDAFRGCRDEVVQMLTDEYGNIRTEYGPIYEQLAHEPSGREMDLKMAALVLYIHPELYGRYPEIDARELNPKIVFGTDMPESPDEIWNRIKICDDKDIFMEHEKPYEKIGNGITEALEQMERNEMSL